MVDATTIYVPIALVGGAVVTAVSVALWLSRQMGALRNTVSALQADIERRDGRLTQELAASTSAIRETMATLRADFASRSELLHLDQRMGKLENRVTRIEATLDRPAQRP